MPVSTYAYQHYLLDSIRGELGAGALKEIAQAPGIQSVYRVTCHRPADDLPDSVATLISSIAGQPTLTVSYTDGTAVESTLTADAYRELTSAFARAKFDNMSDQSDIPTQGVPLWLVERAAGSFAQRVLIAPETAEGPHANLIAYLRAHLAQAIEVDSA